MNWASSSFGGAGAVFQYKNFSHEKREGAIVGEGETDADCDGAIVSWTIFIVGVTVECAVGRILGSGDGEIEIAKEGELEEVVGKDVAIGTAFVSSLIDISEKSSSTDTEAKGELVPPAASLMLTSSGLDDPLLLITARSRSART